MSAKLYSFKKLKHALRQTYKLVKKKRRNLSEQTRQEFKVALNSLQEGIQKKDREKASESAHQLESLKKIHLKKNLFEQARDLIGALLFALILAVVIRQVWFEFYEIPTGSMRPTFREQDRLLVTKTAFGINLPLTTSHVLFDPSLVKRNGIMIFTGKDMDIRDVRTRYFYLFPGYKQYIKRLIGKPGDTLYFYGGKIYGIDAFGQDISHELNPALLDKIDHVPFIHFDGKPITPPRPVNGVYSPVTIYQMNEAVAKLTLSPLGRVKGDLLPLTYNPKKRKEGKPKYKRYFDMWGYQNFGMGRLLTKSEMQTFSIKETGLTNEPLYLEIIHHPNFTSATIARDPMGRVRPMLGLEKSILPLSEDALRKLFESLYTARFIVENGKARRYGAKTSPYDPALPGVPNGCYEFYHGVASKIGFLGASWRLPSDHPIYSFSIDRIKFFYNLGIEFDLRFEPARGREYLYPSRYVYFRDGDLYLMGAPVIKKTTPSLVDFTNREYLKQSSALSSKPYYPFQDTGAPLTSEGKLDIAFIRQYGIPVPEGQYLVLGDNYAMSADSRAFGFVPEGNIRGAPSFIFWPFGPRFGAPLQPPYPWITLSRGIVWILALVVIGGGVFWQRKRYGLPLDLDKLD